jgi:hypothetical protein
VFCPHPYQPREESGVSSIDNMPEAQGTSEVEPSERDYLVTGTIQLLMHASDETEAIIKFKDAVNDMVNESEYPCDGSNGSTVDDVREF